MVRWWMCRPTASTRSSAVAERPRDASCLSVLSFQHTYSTVFLLLVTAASALLVHKILLNSVLLSAIVSGGVRPKPPGQTTLGHNPLFAAVRGSVGVRTQFRGRIGSVVRVSVSFLQNTRRVS